MFFIPALIDSRTAPPTDAVILHSSAPRRLLFVREDFFRTVRRFTGIRLYFFPRSSTSVMTAPSILLSMVR